MAMTSGSVSRFDLTEQYTNIDNIRNRLNNHHFTQQAMEQDLNVIIRLDNQIGNLTQAIRVISGVIYDEYIRTRKHVINEGRDEQGLPNYQLIRDPQIEVRVGSFWITNNGYVINDRKANRGFISHALHHALEVPVCSCQIDIERIANEFRNNWIGAIDHRAGHWQKGVLYGDDIRQDDCVGETFAACSKNQVGGYTGYFGEETKFKATREGSVVVYRDFTGDFDAYLRFFIDIISPFIIE